MPTNLTTAQFKEQMRKHQDELDKTMAWLKEMTTDPTVPSEMAEHAKRGIEAIQNALSDDLALILKLQAKVHEGMSLLKIAAKLMGEMAMDIPAEKN